MSIVGLDHIVVNTKDVDRAIGFYQDILGMEILRLEQFREGKVLVVVVDIRGLRVRPGLG